MIRVLMKYKCGNDGNAAWHDHLLTQEDVDWHDTILKFALKYEKVCLKESMGDWYGWYIAIKEAIKYLKKQNEVEGATVVFIKHHPIKKCCDDSRKQVLLYPRHPLKQVPVNQLDKNSKISHRDSKVGKFVKASTTKKASYEELSKQMPFMQQRQRDGQQQDEIMDSHHYKNCDMYVDENDTHDGPRHFPQHHEYPSKSLTTGKK